MLSLQNTNPKIFYSGAIVIGFLGVIDGAMMLLGQGNSLNQAFSLIEVCWFLISIYFFFSFKSQELSLLIPTVYIGYTFYGLLIGAVLLYSSPTGDLSLPVWYMVTATLFNLVYLVLTWFIYQKWYRH